MSLTQRLDEIEERLKAHSTCLDGLDSLNRSINQRAGTLALYAHAPADLAYLLRLLRIAADAECDRVKNDDRAQPCEQWLKAYTGEMDKALEKWGCLACRIQHAAASDEGGRAA